MKIVKLVAPICGIVVLIGSIHITVVLLPWGEIYMQHYGPLGALMNYIVYLGPICLLGVGFSVFLRQWWCFVLNLVYVITIVGVVGVNS